MNNDLQGMSDYLKALASIERPILTNMDGIYETIYVHMTRTERFKLGVKLFLKALFNLV